MTINHSRLTNNDPADGWNCITESEKSGSTLTVKKTYLWGADFSGTLQGAGGVGGLITVKLADQSKELFYCYDGNGNAIRLLDLTSQNLDTVGLYDYDPYGRVISSSGTYKDYNDYRYSTKRVDRYFGQYYYGYRHYSADLGRWITRDPIGEQGGLNLYGFVGNRPVFGYDILGLVCNIISSTSGKWSHEYIMSEDYDVSKYKEYKEYKENPEGEKLPYTPIDDEGNFSMDFMPGDDNFFKGKVDYSTRKARGDETYKTEWLLNGTFKAGKSKGKSCACKDCDSVRSCISAVGKEWQGSFYCVPGRHCKTFVNTVMKKCCLKKVTLGKRKSPPKRQLPSPIDYSKNKFHYEYNINKYPPVVIN